MSDKRTWKYEPEDGNEVAFIGEYDGERMIRFVCEFIDPPSAEDAALMIAAKNSTHPADAALADLIAHMEHGAKLVDAIGALCRDGSPERNAADAIRKAAAALRARAVPQSAPAGFVEWLCQEMPPGTVISDPAWWAPKIHRAMLAASKEDGK